MTLALTLTLALTVGRVWAYGWMVPLLGFVVYIHGIWLPRHGVNGWTDG